MVAEGNSASEVDLVPAFEIAEYGLAGPTEVACLPLRYQLAQKLHACTSVRVDGAPNDRWRDLVDIVLIRGMLDETHMLAVRSSCIEIFALRDTHPWPPAIVVPSHWAAQYAHAVTEMEFPIAIVDEAAARVTQIIGEIDAAV